MNTKEKKEIEERSKRQVLKALFKGIIQLLKNLK